jgi:ribosome biogenesis GTPase
MDGIIIKGIGGFYYVKVLDKVFECKARGKFRHNDLSPLVGDRVKIDLENNKGFITHIYKRTSMLIRPSIANVTKAFVVFSIKNPDFNTDLLNKFLLLCEANNLEVVICFNKIDLASKNEIENCVSFVKSIGYESIFVNGKTGEGIDKLKKHLFNNITVFSGPSGVGKSTILNNIIGTNKMETGEISERLKRGKHTTRHSELIEIEGGYLADSPGFSSLNIDFIKKEELKNFFREFDNYSDLCRFNGCNHNKEPNCAVKAAVEKGEINKIRYDFYIKTLEEISNRREWK